MNLSERNAFLKAGIVFCAVLTLLIIVASFILAPVYQNLGENINRPSDFLQAFIGKFIKVDYFAVHASLIMSVVFALFWLIFIHSYFEQTSAPEIVYVAIFSISFSFEIIRLILPLNQIYSIPSFYLMILARTLLFVRFFGIFSLLAASICAAGLEVQKIRTIIIIIFLTALIITFGVPIDTGTWDTSLNMSSGYYSHFRMIEIVVFFSTILGFFVAANVRGSRDYAFIGIGVMLALIGRNLLLKTDNWACPVPGLTLLCVGTWFMCSKMHKIHLWL